MSKWSDETKPYLLLCDDFIPMSSAEAAVAFWKNLGYQFRNVKIGDPIAECETPDAPFGSIRVKLPTSATASILKGKLAVTSTVKYIDTNTLHSATITMHSFALDKRYTLEHEIGHALGWGHVETTGHIMNPKWVNIGSKSAGVRHDCYSFSHD
jgi:predicted Zn-dependent protease